MNRFTGVVFVSAAVLANGLVAAEGDTNWRIDSAAEWKSEAREIEGLAVNDDLLGPVDKKGMYRSKLQSFKAKRSAQTMTLSASTMWENWEPARKVAPRTLGDAPIFLAKGPGDYWLLGRNKAPRKGKFKPEAATLEGFDLPLQTTPLPNLFNAPGGLKKNLGGYHAWQSRDMVNWVHHGPVTA